MSEAAVITRDGLDALIAALATVGYRVCGPTVRDQAIVYDDIEGIDDLPEGWTDEQEGGHYRLKRRTDDALFGFVVGPQSWKKYLHPPRQVLWRSQRTDQGTTIAAEPPSDQPRAFIGVRPCELAAIAVQDRVMMEGSHIDPHYAARRKNTFIVAVNCGRAVSTCFCTSMGTGPRATSGYDIALTRAVADAVRAPVIASGGVGTLDHLVAGIRDGHATAVLAASIFHFGTYTIAEAKAYMAEAGLPMRLDRAA